MVMVKTAQSALSARRHGPQADPDQRAELLTAASKLLATEGPGALTVRRIAAEAGCSTMGVYSRFGGKDGIVEALFVEGFQGLAAAMGAVPDTDDPVADLLACGVAYRRFALEHPTSYAVMFERVVPSYEPTPDAIVIANGTFELLVHRVARARSTGAMPAGEPLEIAQWVWASCHGWVSLEIHGLIKIDDADGTAFERAMTALCANGRSALSEPAAKTTKTAKTAKTAKTKTTKTQTMKASARVAHASATRSPRGRV
jgi:AcrR family transcriptional regulator